MKAAAERIAEAVGASPGRATALLAETDRIRLGHSRILPAAGQRSTEEKLSSWTQVTLFVAWGP